MLRKLDTLLVVLTILAVLCSITNADIVYEKIPLNKAKTRSERSDLAVKARRKAAVKQRLESYLTETEPNDDLDNADLIEIGDTMGGEINPDYDIDFFVFSATAGTWIVANIDAWDYDSWLDSILVLYDADGNTIAENDDEHDWTFDSCITYEIPADGKYYLSVEDYWWDGGLDYYYDLILLQIEPPTWNFSLVSPIQKVCAGDWATWYAEVTCNASAPQPLQLLTRFFTMPPDFVVGWIWPEYDNAWISPGETVIIPVVTWLISPDAPTCATIKGEVGVETFCPAWPNQQVEVATVKVVCCCTMMASDTNVVETLYEFRDKVLAQSEMGQLLIDAYYDNSAEIVKVFSKNPMLCVRGANILKQALPGIKFSLGNKNGKNIVFTRSLVARTQKLFTDIRKESDDKQLSETLSWLSEILDVCKSKPVRLVQDVMKDCRTKRHKSRVQSDKEGGRSK